jgi:tetratricopeptide (TPR) repeat protein
MIRADPATSRAEAQRFRNEAEMAAGLDHPNIVPVYEVAEHADQLYFSMKRIVGGSLAEKLDCFAANPKAAARLVAQVARAVHHAHQRGILHRDLKPANILLDAQGQPHVTDFGLARRVERDSSLTQSGALVGTPSYMAPEQTSGQKGTVTTAADGYGLGAILYTLLTGAPPFRADTVVDTLLLVRESEPVPPGRVNPKVDRDLETICLKCLAKEPGRRYPSAEALAEDLERWLAGQPIQARPIGRLARLWRWCRRNPKVAGLMGFVALLVIVVVVGSLVGTWLIWQQMEQKKEQQLRAEQNLDAAYRILDAVFVDLAEKLLPQQQALTPEDRQILEKVLAFYEQFAKQDSTAPKVRAKSGEAHLRVAEIQTKLGQGKQGRDNYHQAVALFKKLVAEFPDNPDYRHRLARCYLSLGDTQDYAELPGRGEEWEQAERQSVTLLEQLSRELPARLDYQQDLAKAYDRLAQSIDMASRWNSFEASGRYDDFPSFKGTASWNARWRFESRSRFDEQEKNFQRALAIRTTLAKDHPTVAAYQLDFNESLGSVAYLFADAGKFQKAEELARRTLDLRSKLVAKFPNNESFRFHLGWGYQLLGDLMRRAGRLHEAEEQYRRALAVREKLASELASVPTRRLAVSRSYALLASLLNQIHRFQEAEQVCRQAVEINDKLATAFPTVPEYRDFLAFSHNGLGVVLMNSGQRAAAAEHCRRAIDIVSKLVTDFPTAPAYRDQLAIHTFDLGKILSLSAQPQEAGQAYRRMRSIYEKLAADFPGDAECQSLIGARLNDLALEFMSTAHLAEARQILEQAIDQQKIALRLNPNSHPRYNGWLCIHYLALADVLLQLGQEDAAPKRIQELVRDATQCSLNNAEAQTQLARFLATCRNPRFRDPQRAVELARRASEMGHQRASLGATLRMARYRLGDWRAAVAALEKANELPQDEGPCATYFFLAMAHRQLGHEQVAVHWYKKGVDVLEKNKINLDNPQIRLIRAEAAALLGLAKSAAPEGRKKTAGKN